MSDSQAKKRSQNIFSRYKVTDRQHIEVGESMTDTDSTQVHWSEYCLSRASPWQLIHAFPNSIIRHQSRLPLCDLWLKGPIMIKAVNMHARHRYLTKICHFFHAS